MFTTPAEIVDAINAAANVIRAGQAAGDISAAVAGELSKAVWDLAIACRRQLETSATRFDQIEGLIHTCAFNAERQCDLIDRLMARPWQLGLTTTEN